MNGIHGIHPAPRNRGSAAPPRVRRAWSLAAAILIAGSGLTACGGSGHSGSESKASGSGGSNAGDPQAKAVKYAECMRENGVPDFPDPVNGRTLITKTKGGGGVDLDSPRFKAAQEKCRSLQPQSTAGPGGDNSAMLKFAQCMRKNGVANFPDPQNGMMRIKPGQGIDPNAPQFKAAQKACQKYLPGGTQ